MSIQTLPELFLTAVREHARPDCFSYRDDSGQYVDVSSEEAHRRVRALRLGLKSLGVRPGDRVALFMDRVPELYIGFVGILKAGCIVQPLFSAFVQESLETRMEDAGTSVVITQLRHARKIRKIRENLPAPDEPEAGRSHWREETR